MEQVQTKHHLHRQPSLSDKSPDFWKTIRVWAEGVLSGEMRLPGMLLSLLTTATATEGSAPSYLRHRDRDEDKALRAMRNVAIGSSVSAENMPGVTAFNQLAAPQQRSLVEAIRVFDASPNVENVREKIADHLFYAADRKNLDGLVDRVEGWWFRRVISHLSGRDSLPILGMEVEAEVERIREQFQADNLTIDFYYALPPEGVSPQDDKRQFVEQLRLIAVSVPRIGDAIRDYYRAYQQQARWLNEDQLVWEELAAYEDRLVDEWMRLSNRVLEELKETSSEDEKRAAGRNIYNWIQEHADIPIRPKCREPYVLRGTYQMLADANPARVGWHPEFEARLAAILSKPIT